MDLEIIQRKGTLPVESFRVQTIFDPPVLDIFGPAGYNSIDSVFINGEKSTKLAIISDKRVLASVPTGTTTIQELQVLTKDTAVVNQVIFESGLAKKPRTLSGVDKVTQKVIKVLMTTPGSDAFNPTLGGGLNSYIGKAFASSSELSAEVATAIRTTEEAIIASESRQDLSDREKLGGITILSVQPIDKVGLSIELQIINRLGETGRTSIEL